jgi:cytochrome P450
MAPSLARFVIPSTSQSVFLRSNLLAVPQEERGPLRDWSLAILGALEPVIGPEVFARGNKAVKDFLAYQENLVERRRAKPGNPERDVLTRLIQGEDNGERLTSKEG